MRIPVIIAILLISVSCGSSRKALRNKKPAPPPTTTAAPAATQPVKAEPVVTAPPGPVKEVEERLLPVDNKPPDPHRYFVITGSFRNPDNAKRFQGQLTKQNFRPEILRSETGFYRVSVMATDEVNRARTEVHRIRAAFPGYSDTWLLIQKR